MSIRQRATKVRVQGDLKLEKSVAGSNSKLAEVMKLRVPKFSSLTYF